MKTIIEQISQQLFDLEKVEQQKLEITCAAKKDMAEMQADIQDQVLGYIKRIKDTSGMNREPSTTWLESNRLMVGFDEFCEEYLFGDRGSFSEVKNFDGYQEMFTDISFYIISKHYKN